jgi:RNA methyltransferase, TrmH family
VREALGAGAVVDLFGTIEGYGRARDLVEAAQAAGVGVWPITEHGLATLTDTVTPQGIVAVCRHLHHTDLRAVVDPGNERHRFADEGPRLVVVLASVADPGNAGTVLRTADAAGASAVVFTEGSVDPYNGKCVRASAGSLFHVDIVRGGTTGETVRTLRAAGLTMLAADAHGPVDLDEYADAGGLSARTAWLFGSEAHGLPTGVADIADARVKVATYGLAESLNLAAAAAVCLYASARAHHRPGAVHPAAVREAPS